MKLTQSQTQIHNHKIQFTIEEESNEKICFLDVLITEKGKKLILTGTKNQLALVDF